MNLAIAYSPDPVYMNPFIYDILKENSDIVKLVIETNSYKTMQKTKRQQFEYLNFVFIIVDKN